MPTLLTLPFIQDFYSFFQGDRFLSIEVYSCWIDLSVNGRLEKFWLQELTRPAFEDWLKNEDAPVVVIGLGAIEQHGPHLPLGTDSYDAMAMIQEVAKRTNSVCLLPTWIGYSPHHMGFKGTITFSEDTYLNVLLDTISSLAQHGVKRFVFYSGHGGNSNIMNLAISNISD